MKRIRSRLFVVHNIGLVDRMSRLFIGTALLAGGIVSMFNTSVLTWEPYAMLISVYPLMTSMLGWDPFYASVDARTCSLEGGRNACGTFPFEVDAMVVGDKLVPDSDFDHSLTSAHHKPERKKAA
ncbi:MAG: DUF2892 domain-containing protein [Gammaproteobacteria bacterium]|nr:DUF2892 domain-containing protein [Gammaproteobacteria bacterium]